MVYTFPAGLYTVFSMYDWWFLIIFDIIPLFFLFVTIKITSFIQKQSKSTKISTKLENYRIMSKNHQKTKHSHIQDLFDDFLVIFDDFLIHVTNRPEIVRYMVWNSILADVKILKVHTCKRVSSYLKTLKIYLWTWKFIPVNMRVHTCKHQVHTFKPGVHIKIINFCIGPNKIQKIFALRRAVVQEVTGGEAVVSDSPLSGSQNVWFVVRFWLDSVPQ